MLLHTRGIVFRTVKYGETSVIADIFTEEEGLHSFIAGSVRTARSRMPFGFFQPMMVVDLVAYYQEGKQSLCRIREMRPALVYSGIPFDLKKGAVSLFMAEVCRKCIRETEENRALFDFLYHTVAMLDATPHPIANLHLCFLMHLAEHLGFLPEPYHGGNAWFDLREGIFSESLPPHTDYLSPGDSARFGALLELPLEQFYTQSIPATDRRQLLAHILKFYAFHVPGFGKIHTTEVLEACFR